MRQRILDAERDATIVLAEALDREVDDPTPRRPRPRPQKLDPFKPLIETRLGTYPLLSAVPSAPCPSRRGPMPASGPPNRAAT